MSLWNTLKTCQRPIAAVALRKGAAACSAPTNPCLWKAVDVAVQRSPEFAGFAAGADVFDCFARK
ncbi:hypothetical protein EHYA_10045 [Embleya hyalina]|uniref:Uncharacterized protein n=1 Tax=Embleya hyalina TaxID=516124 RepID=A0A401Z626_9ACTN|nr:hypothetical protein EHYA_10045 [Embleya hyalina]